MEIRNIIICCSRERIGTWNLEACYSVRPRTCPDVCNVSDVNNTAGNNQQTSLILSNQMTSTTAEQLRANTVIRSFHQFHQSVSLINKIIIMIRGSYLEILISSIYVHMKYAAPAKSG